MYNTTLNLWTCFLTWTTRYPKISRCLFLNVTSPFSCWIFLQKDLESRNSTATLRTSKIKVNQRFFTFVGSHYPCRSSLTAELQVAAHPYCFLVSLTPSEPFLCLRAAESSAHCTVARAGFCPECTQSLGRQTTVSKTIIYYENSLFQDCNSHFVHSPAQLTFVSL